MIEKEIEHLKSMKVNVPPEWATDKYVLVDEYQGWPWDKEKFPDAMNIMPPARVPGSTIKRMCEIINDDKIPIVIVSESMLDRKESQTMRHHELRLMCNVSRHAVLLVEWQTGKYSRVGEI